MLATIGIVDCTFRCIGLLPSHSLLVYGEQPFYFRLDETERNENVTIFFTTIAYITMNILMNIIKFLLTLPSRISFLNFVIVQFQGKKCLATVSIAYM